MDTTENNVSWVIILITILSSLLISIIVSAIVVKDKQREYTEYFDTQITELRSKVDSLNTVINENKELPAFEVIVNVNNKTKKDTTILKPLQK